MIRYIVFQGVMVRLMLVLAPVMCILGGIGASSLLLKYMKEIDSGKVVDKKSKKFESNYVLRKEVSQFCNIMFYFRSLEGFACSVSAVNQNAPNMFRKNT